MSMTDKYKKKMTRRDFMKKAGMTAAAVGVSSLVPKFVKPVKAAARDYVLIGYTDPSTGPLAGLGEATPWVNDRVTKQIEKMGGVYIKELKKKVPVRFKVVDTESSPTKAADVASRLIMNDKIDLMLTMYTPDVVNPVSAVCERYQMPCVGVGCPIDPWLEGGPYKWSYLTHFGVDGITNLFIDMWDEIAAKTNKVVGVLFPNDADGIIWTKIFNTKLAKKGYKMVDPGRFPFGQRDFSSQIEMFKKEKVEILTAVLIAPDWATAWRQMHQQGFQPKMATIAKAILFPSAIEALGGTIGNGLTTEIWWSRHHPYKSSLTGETGNQLCDAWTKETKKQWIPPIGLTYGGYEMAFDVIKRAETLDKAKLRDAIEKTNLTTIFAPIKYNEKHYCEIPLVGGQWVKGKQWPWDLETVYNKNAPHIPKTAEMIFPLPK
jgi:branched-chain amino acid transport system substrate-binding protein